MLKELVIIPKRRSKSLNRMVWLALTLLRLLLTFKWFSLILNHLHQVLVVLVNQARQAVQPALVLVRISPLIQQVQVPVSPMMKQPAVVVLHHLLPQVIAHRQLRAMILNNVGKC